MRISIVGGGPAGAMAAIELARAGARPTVFDHSHPREKPCGGGLTGRALALVSDVAGMRHVGVVTAASAIVQHGSREVDVSLVDRGVSVHSSLLIVSRAEFDSALLDAAEGAGAEIVREQVCEIRKADTSFVLRTRSRERTADIVIGADGASSIVRKTFARPFRRREMSVAAGHFAHGTTARSIVLKMAPEIPGYLWSFPRADHLAVGACGPAVHITTSGALSRESRTWIAGAALPGGVRLERYAWPIPSVGASDPRGALAGRGWLLAGDAAGLVDPLTREGIYYALLSGKWAAEAALGGGAHAGARYEARIRTHVLPELARAARLSRLFFTPAFAALFVRALEESAPIRRVFAELVAGTQPYRGLRRRLLKTGEWRLASRAIRMALAAGFASTMKPAAISLER